MYYFYRQDIIYKYRTNRNVFKIYKIIMNQKLMLIVFFIWLFLKISYYYAIYFDVKNKVRSMYNSQH